MEELEVGRMKSGWELEIAREEEGGSMQQMHEEFGLYGLSFNPCNQSIT